MGADPDIEHFIQYSSILTEEKRRKLIGDIVATFNGNDRAREINSDDPIERGIHEQFRALISNLDLLDACQQYPEIAHDVTIKFIKGINDSATNDTRVNPFHEEEEMHVKYQQKKDDAFLKSYDTLDSYLASQYAPEEIDLPFYARAARELTKLHERVSDNEIISDEKPEIEAEEPVFKGIKTNDELRDKLQGFKQEIMADWRGHLEKKKQDHILEEIDKARKEACKELYSNIEKFRKMMKVLNPFSKELGRLWDLSKGNWKAIDFDIITQYAALLEKQKSLQKLAEMLGRLHSAERNLEEQQIEVRKIRYFQKIDHSQKSEIVSVHESDDLQYCLPQELVLLGSPDTEMLFYLKFAEKKLLTYQLINRTSEEVHFAERQNAWLPEKNKRGPIIICVDTSGSMHGTPETIAKTMCFALLRIALLENRQCFLISFSTEIETLEMTSFNKSYTSLIQFLTHSFQGGTDGTPALVAALHQIKIKNYEKADVLMISDFVMDEVTAQVVQGIESAKKRGTKFHSLVISSEANPAVMAIFDNSWLYDPNNKAVITQMVQNLRLKV